MQITVTFNSIDEMKDFTELVVVGRKQEEMKSPVAPVQPVPPQPTSPVQQQSAPVQQPVPDPHSVPVTPVQTTSRQYTPDDLARAAMALMDSGRQQELVGLLQQFGVVAIPELRPDQLGAFATALRGMGAQI